MPNLQKAYANAAYHSKARFDTNYVLIFNSLQCLMASKDEIDMYQFILIAASEQHTKNFNNHSAIVPNLQKAHANE